MKQVSVIGTAIFSLLFGATAIATAQHDEHGKDQGQPRQAPQSQPARPAQQAPQQPARPAQQAPQQQQARPAQQTPQQQQARPAQPQQFQQGRQQPGGGQGQRQGRPQQNQPTYGGAYHGGVQFNGPTNGGVHSSGVPQRQDQVHSGFGQSRAGSWRNEHQSWHQRGGYNGYRIPDARFRLFFGHDHFFRIDGLPLVFVGGQPRFQYDGYWITIVDPWPESWGQDWYETDDVYLDNTEDGYYLYDRNYPDYPIAVTVSY